jgi:hypothetical protein
MARRPVMSFLPRSGYRHRRLRDAARLLPLFGLFLIILPILWSPVDDDHRRTATDGLYLFGVWSALIGVAAIFARPLSRGEDKDQTTTDRAGAAAGDHDAL